MGVVKLNFAKNNFEKSGLCQKVEDRFADMQETLGIKVADNAELIELADQYCGKVIAFENHKGEQVEGLLLFVLVDWYNQKSVPLHLVKQNENSYLLDNFQQYYDEKLLGIYPEYLEGVTQLTIRQHLNKTSDFMSYMEVLKDDENMEQQNFEQLSFYPQLCDISNLDDHTQQINQLNQLVEQTKFDISLLAAIINQINSKPMLSVIN
tara:strand:- start:54 stop:677 length:624 start_codon:yes stop_codon:yes gene_type:complete